MPTIDAILHRMIAQHASDVHLTTSFQPYVREHGEIKPLAEFPVLTEQANRDLLYEIMPADNRVQFEQTWDTDFAYEIPDLARFRVNVFMDRNGIGGVLRQIPSKIPTADELGLPKTVRDFCYLTKGLVVVTGPTGSGKSTTLAAMIDLINRTRTDHIITIEDPIEFVHKPIRCLINQREVHKHTKSFSNALRAALREDPDIVLVGEMRDLETIEIAIETAETGHLVFGTLHTNSAATTVDRIIDKFPPDRQNQIRTMLADSLKGVVAQTLCRKRAGGRCAALEVLVCTSGIASNIRDGKTHQIPASMQVGRALGMQMFNDHLMELVQGGLITTREAYMRAIDKVSLAKIFEDHGLPLDMTFEETATPGPTAPAAPADYEAILKEHREALRANPDSIDSLNTVAWILATNLNPKLRGGREAVKLAERANALAKGTNLHVLDTLAAAYAEAGQFPKALETARHGIHLAQVSGQEDMVAAFTRQVALYEKGQPLRDG
jgi:twitching motility protein PilT